ncbi:MAG: hypothetical protein K8H86_00840, partial [Ignavibacteriaceae bacterium]|nr:hypothetical protein [Ignavibacteriaceae bacterium]
MNIRTKQILFWAPRVLSIFFALFASLFALDVFNNGYNLGNTLLVLAIHLIPTVILIAAIVI